jgi:hypothetical protein
MNSTAFGNIRNFIVKYGNKITEGILSILTGGSAIASLFCSYFDIIFIIVYGLFVVIYTSCLIYENIHENKPITLKLLLVIICPLLVGSSSFVIIYNIIGYLGEVKSFERSVKQLWDADVIFSFTLFCGTLSLAGSIAYSIVRKFLKKGLQQIAYAVTCIPVSKDNNCDIKILLIKNESHDKNPWMFPGGHLRLEENLINDKEKDFIKNERISPSYIIDKKCKEEANIDIEIVDLINNRIVNSKALFSSPECEQSITPVFHMKFLVSDGANCYKEYGHRMHYDFTYIAKYKPMQSTEAKSKYKTVEVPFSFKDFSFKEDKRIDDVNIVNGKIINAINNDKDGDRGGDRNKLILSSIPELVYETLRLFRVKKPNRSNLLNQ